MNIPFTKMSGAGNDFVVVDNRFGSIKDPSVFAQMVCRRRHSIGADGVLLLETSAHADFEMKYYNADGSNAGMCGNGGRCLAKFAYDHGIVSTEEFSFEAFGHVYRAQRFDNELYELVMKQPSTPIMHQKIQLLNMIVNANYINTGTDHCVIFLDENPHLGQIETVDITGIGKEIRYHAMYSPTGTNVNFVSRNDAKSIVIRTYERGVEDETLACGTGSVASALLSADKFQLKSPVDVIVRSGERLTVSFTKEQERFSKVRLKGSAVTTFNGFIVI